MEIVRRPHLLTFLVVTALLLAGHAAITQTSNATLSGTGPSDVQIGVPGFVALTDPREIVEDGRTFSIAGSPLPLAAQERVIAEIGRAAYDAFAAVASHTATAPPPNIVYILADDLGYGDVRAYNPKGKIPTPNIDRLAGQGMRFTDAHSGSAVCSPTRYGILTGRYAWRTRLRSGVLAPQERPLIDAGRMTVATLLKRHGYHTAAIGKWHLGWDWPKVDGKVVFDRPIANGPTARGFDHYFGTDVPNYPPYAFIDNDRVIAQPTAMKPGRDLDGQPGPMVPGWKFDAVLPTLAQRAVRYLGERAPAKQPFFLYLPLTSPHEPIAPSGRWQGKSRISDVADFIMETDWAVGEVLAALDRHKLAKNTLVFFTSDNGHADYTGLPALQSAGHAPSGPLRGYKRDIYEGGHRVPFIARWPGRIKPRTVSDETVALTNLLATCAELLGTTLPETAGEDSFSILPVLTGGKRGTPTHAAVVHQAGNGTLAIRQGPWKLVVEMAPEATSAPAAPSAPTAPVATSTVQLFDLSRDLGEKNEVSAEHPDVVARLSKLLEAYASSGRSTPGPAQPNDVTVDIRRRPTK